MVEKLKEIKSLDQIIKTFKDEFNPILTKFEIIRVLKGQKFNAENVRKAEHICEKIDIIWHPGVYVFYSKGNVYRLGRHFENSRLRVLQHIRDNTRNDIHSIKDLESSDDVEVILFNVIDIKDYHWVAAVEVFLEKKLDPLIPALRQG
ncbi:MAG TPA: hypothetical protein PLN13_09435 [Bacteroidia bacterium]|nr:hypothetical protein [Bacteroidia bacterium]HRH08791.1 hypothetical protein [Bacteroidia bacterium]